MTSTDVLQMLVSNVLRVGGPAAVQVFVKRGMSCPGCPFAPFETVADVAATYWQNPDDLAAALLHTGVGGAAVMED